MEGQIKGSQVAAGQVCMQFAMGDLQVSISMDDSCQQKIPTEFVRFYLKVFSGPDYKNDVTEEYFGETEVCGPSVPDVLRAFDLLAQQRVFTFYWLSGSREVLRGRDASDALNRAGYGAGALRALDFHDHGECDDYEWNKVDKKWDRKTPIIDTAGHVAS